MRRLQFLLIASALALSGCNDDPVFLPLPSDTDPGDTSERDTDAGDATTDARLDAPADATSDLTPDVPELDAPGPDTPEPDTEPDLAPDIDPPDAEPDIPPGDCTLGEECGDGGVCAYENIGCGLDPGCVDLCPTTDPVNVCGCEGVVLREVPACSFSEFAYVLDGVDQRSELEGLDCNPSEFGRIRYSATVQFDDFRRFIGATLHIRVPSNWDDSYVINESHTITEDSFELDFPNSLDTDLFGWFFEWYVDLGGNGLCDSDVDPAWRLFVSNRFDAEPITVEVSAGDTFDESTCDLWDEP